MAVNRDSRTVRSRVLFALVCCFSLVAAECRMFGGSGGDVAGPFLRMVCDERTESDAQNICNSITELIGFRYILLSGSSFNIVLRGSGIRAPVGEIGISHRALDDTPPESLRRVTIADTPGVPSFPRLEVRDLPVSAQPGLYRYRFTLYDIHGTWVYDFDLEVIVVDELPPRYDLAAIVHSTDPEDIIEVSAGDTAFIDIWVIHNGGDHARGVESFTTFTSAGLAYQSHETQFGSYSSIGFWDIGDLAPETVAHLRVHFTADAPGTYTWFSIISSLSNGDTNRDNDVDEAQIIVTATADEGYDLSVFKTVDHDEVQAGETVTFTLTAVNHGPGTPIGAAVLDTLPAGLIYTGHSGGDYTPEIGHWSLPQEFYVPGGTATLTITATAQSTATNTATIVSESDEDTNPGNNSGSVTVTVF